MYRRTQEEEEDVKFSRFYIDDTVIQQNKIKKCGQFRFFSITPPTANRAIQLYI